MDHGQAGRYRTINVRVGSYVPPPPSEVSVLMFELLEWWSRDAPKLSPVLSSSILNYRFEAIHPFADGNGRTGRALALWTCGALCWTPAWSKSAVRRRPGDTFSSKSTIPRPPQS